jgi:hypothetical protein
MLASLHIAPPCACSQQAGWHRSQRSSSAGTQPHQKVKVGSWSGAETDPCQTCASCVICVAFPSCVCPSCAASPSSPWMAGVRQVCGPPGQPLIGNAWTATSTAPRRCAQLACVEPRRARAHRSPLSALHRRYRPAHACTSSSGQYSVSPPRRVVSMTALKGSHPGHDRRHTCTIVSSAWERCTLRRITATSASITVASLLSATWPHQAVRQHSEPHAEKPTPLTRSASASPSPPEAVRCSSCCISACSSGRFGSGADLGLIPSACNPQTRHQQLPRKCGGCQSKCKPLPCSFSAAPGSLSRHGNNDLRIHGAPT